MKKVGVLALQGAVSEHMQRLRELACLPRAVKNSEDLHGLDALVLPGGESTTISRLIVSKGLFEPIKRFALKKWVLGTCAGLILCASEVAGPDRGLKPLGLIDCRVERNGFGRQVDSFETPLAVAGLGDDIPAVFIRAPYICSVGADVRVLAGIGEKIVMAETDRVLVCAFHPELSDDTRVLTYFLRKIH